MGPRLALACDVLIHSLVEQIFNSVWSSVPISEWAVRPCLHVSKSRGEKMPTWALRPAPQKSLKRICRLPPLGDVWGTWACVAFIIIVSCYVIVASPVLLLICFCLQGNNKSLVVCIVETSQMHFRSNSQAIAGDRGSLLKIWQGVGEAHLLIWGFHKDQFKGLYPLPQLFMFAVWHLVNRCQTGGLVREEVLAFMMPFS